MVAMSLDGTGGFQWERLYAELRTGGTWTQLDLVDHALSYLRRAGTEAVGPLRLTLDPLVPVPRRYVYPELDLLDVALALTHQLAGTIRRVMATHEPGAAIEARAAEGMLLARLAQTDAVHVALADERDAMRRELALARAERDLLLARTPGLQGPPGP
jgi:hypothetical protein